MYYRISKGFTLLEVLVSLILLSFILFIFDAMEIDGLRSVRSTYYFHIATHQLISMAERLRALGQSSSIREQIDIWSAQNQQLLPKGVGEVIDNFPRYRISVYWGEISHECNKIQLGQSGCVSLNITV